MLPKDSEVAELLALQGGVGAEIQALLPLLDETLLRPAADILGRPAKRIRARLVEIGFAAGSGGVITDEDRRACGRCADALEVLHAGSLVVDDIQDGSLERRGDSSLHVRYGIPVALNAGNWLYFWPLELVRGMNLDPNRELRMYRELHSTLLRAHFGQALDVGCAIDKLSPEQVEPTCLAAMELKTGALMALALTLGAILARASEEVVEALREYGHGLGLGLQMLDDLGYKRLEDLRLRRPSWIWAFAAAHLDSEEYGRFVAAVRELPEAGALAAWMDSRAFLALARMEACDRIERSFGALERRLGPEFPVLEEIREIQAKVKHAFH